MIKSLKRDKLGRTAEDETEAMNIMFSEESDDQEENEAIKEIHLFPKTNFSKMDEVIIRMDTLETQLSFLIAKINSVDKKLNTVLDKLS